MSSFAATLRRKWKFIATISGGLLALSSCLMFPVQAFNPKDLDTVLSGKNCVECDLSEADLVGRDLKNIILRNSNLSQAKLGFANLKNADLSGANLSGAELFSAFLFSANLRKANLQGAILMGSYLHKADLDGANLSGADLSRAFLFDTKLSGANLSGANLEGSILSGANLSETNLSKAILKETFYDQSTLFPSDFEPKTAGLVTSRPSPEPRKLDPDRYDVRLAERHQISMAAYFLMWAAADEGSYGGCQDLACYDLPIVVTERLLKLDREIFGEESSEVTSDLFLLANHYLQQKKYNKAESLYLQGLNILEKQNSLFDIATNLRELARIYRLQGRYNEAGSLLEKALNIFESPELEAKLTAKYKRDFLERATTIPEFGGMSEQDLAEIVEKTKTDEIVQVLNDLADVYLSVDKYAEAEALYKQTLELQKNQSDDSINPTLLKLAWAHHAEGHKAEAEALYQQIIKKYKEGFSDDYIPEPILEIINSIQENLNRLQQSLPPVIDIKWDSNS